MNERITIGFGGGCHWCTEAVFAAVTGVYDVEQGFIASTPPDDGFSEAVRVSFDPAEIPLGVLIEVHLRTHASTSNHKLRGKYRSAIYVMSSEQRRLAERALMQVQTGYDEPLVTRVLPLVEFRISDEKYRKYAVKNAGGPFCERYIDPKLARLRETHAKHLRSG